MSQAAGKQVRDGRLSWKMDSEEARPAPSLLGDPLLMACGPCVSSACSFKILADASGHGRHDFLLLHSVGQDTAPSSSCPHALGGHVCPADQLRKGDYLTRPCEPTVGWWAGTIKGHRWHSSPPVAIWEFGHGATRSVDFSREAGNPDF